MLGLGRILMSDLVVANLLMYSLPGMILLYLATPFFTPRVFLDEKKLYICSSGCLLTDFEIAQGIETALQNVAI